MKKFVVLLLAAIVALGSSASAARRQGECTVKGSVMNEQEATIEFATVVLLRPDSTQVAGTVTDVNGDFTLTVQQGNYIMCVSCLGYRTATQPIELRESCELEPITITTESTEIESVVVKARLITREADRFVVDVANNPTAIGKNTLEMVGTAPGVWVSDDKIKINGQSGTRIMVNDRLLTNMTESEIAQYLRSIPAENIVRIEVIPVAGADYDADSTGGIIKITVRKQRNDGMEGNVRMAGGYSKSGVFSASPSARINYQQGKLNLYANGTWSRSRYRQQFDEQIDYLKTDNMMHSKEELNTYNTYYGGMVGVVYDIKPNHSVGAEYNYSNSKRDPDTTEGTSTFNAGNTLTENKSYYVTNSDENRQSVTINYIWRIDSLGSTFKLLGDWASSTSNGNSRYRNTSTLSSGGTPVGSPVDTLYRSNTNSDYAIYSITANVDKVLSPTTTLKFGGKFSLNDMYSTSRYEGDQNGTWIENTAQRSTTDYVEKIPALYAIYTTRFNNQMGLSAGLRAEYTSIKKLSQSYLSLFPSVNWSVPLKKDQSAMMVLAYSRKISRPSFWSLNPQRTQLSEYSYIEGDPNLKPTFTNDFSLTTVLGYKYSITFGGQLMQNSVQQTLETDRNDPNILVHRQTNIPDLWQYYCNLNAPIAISKWWNLNANLTGVYQLAQLANETNQRRNLFAIGSINSTVTLPKGFFVEVEYFGISPAEVGNQKQLAMQNVGVTVKKRFWDDRMTATLGLSNIFDYNQRVITETENFVKHTYGPMSSVRTISASLTYNFKAGKKFNARSIEKGASDETSRMNQSSGNQ